MKCNAFFAVGDPVAPESVVANISRLERAFIAVVNWMYNSTVMIQSFHVVIQTGGETIVSATVDQNNTNSSHFLPLMDASTVYTVVVNANGRCRNINPSTNASATLTTGKN